MMKFSRYRNIGIIVLLLLFGCGKKEKEVVLIERDGAKYEQGAQKPYSGKMSSKYNNGSRKTEGQYKDGLPVGTWKFWDRHGTEYTGAVSKYVFHEIQSDETLEKIASDFEVDVAQLYELNEDIDKDTGYKIKAGQVIGIKTADESDGQFLFWYDKKRIKIKSHKVFNNSKRNGKWTIWHENGNLARTSSYAAGKKDGSYAFYFNDGSKKEEGVWKNDQRDGLWVKYANNGNTKKEGKYSNGKKDGVWTTWNDKGLIANKYLYENNKVVDKWAFKYQFYSNGKEKSLKSTRNNKLDGENSSWYENGQMKSTGNFKAGKEDGNFEEWYENSQLSTKKTYVEGVLTGEFSTWYENGQMQNKGSNLEGNKDGAYSDWFDSGQMRQEGSYVDNEFYLTTRWNNEGDVLIEDGNGKWIGKNAEGRKLWAKEYQDGRLISDWEYKYEYYDSGQIKNESSFQGGQEDGESTAWFENGDKREEGVWQEGEYLITNRWNKNGNLIITNGEGRIAGKNIEGLVLWEKEFVGGKLEFQWDNVHEYYDNGQLKSETGYSENEKHGRYSVWYEDGQIKENGKNSYGVPYGFYELWLEDGQKREEGMWTEDGEYLIQNRWNKSGNAIITNGAGRIKGKNKEGLVLWEKEYIGGKLEFQWDNKHEYFDNGQLKSETGYFEDKKHGLYKTWFENGQLKEQGKYQHDNQHDGYAVWFEDGQKREDGLWQDGQYLLMNRWLSNGGQLVANGTGGWIGRKEGLEAWKKFYEDGLLKDEWTFEYEYHENGELKTKTGYQGGAKDGEYISWFDNGKQKEEGLWDEGEFLLRNRWSKNGSILLENGNGSWVGRNANGLEVWKRLYVDGILSKEWDYEYEYHGNGQLMSSKRFNKSINDGQFTTWYESGEKRSEDNWENGKKVGKWFSWHSNGQVESEGFYIDDQKDGLWVFYDETGTKVSEGVYAAGALINNDSLE